MQVQEVLDDTKEQEGFFTGSIYSQKAIMGFTFFCTTIFGGILMYQNLVRVGKRKEAGWVLAGAIAYFIASAAFLIYMDDLGRGARFVLNIGGAAGLAYGIMPNLIPDHRDMPRRSIQTPLLIAIAMIIFFAVLTFVSLSYVL